MVPYTNYNSFDERLPERSSMKAKIRTIGLLMIAILTLGMVEGLLPSHGVSVSPPVSFTFYFGGDTGYYSGSAMEAMKSHQLLQPDFFLNLGDISYNGTSNGNPPTGNEVNWCNFIKANVQNRLGNPNYPYVMIAGNHEDGHAALDGTNDGYIDAFIGDNCLPLSAFNSQLTTGNGYINFIGSGLCTESTTCYGKEGYFDYPASNPIARIITITVADTVGNVSSTSVNYNYCPLSVCGNAGMDAHWNWLTGVVSAAKNAGLWIIVAFHKPCLLPDLPEGCEGNGDYNGHNPNYQLETYLMSHGVDVLLTGHAHIHARSKQLTCLGPTEPPSDSKVNITYSQSCVANDGSSGVYNRGAGTVQIIEGAFSQRDDQLNFTRSDTNYFAKAMSARGCCWQYGNGVGNVCCWEYGNAMNLTAGNGLGMMTVNATQISYNFLPSGTPSRTVTGASEFTDSFVIKSPSNPGGGSSSPGGLSPWILGTLFAGAIGVAAAVSVLIVRRRKRSNQNATKSVASA